MPQQNIGFIGVGRMGGRMARRIVGAGYPLTIYDTSETVMRPLLELGAVASRSPKEVASQCEIVITSLPTPAVVEAVALGPGGVGEGSRVKIFIDMSTTGSVAARRIAKGLEGKGIVAVDAPVSGGLAGAERGTLAVMVSCPEEVLSTVKPLLESTGKVFFCGNSPGLGQTMKLLNNMLSAAALAITSEAVVMGVKAGLEPGLILDVLNAGTARNSATADKFGRFVLPRTFDAGFALGLFNKDLRLCLEEADLLGVPMFVGTAVRQLFSVAMASNGYDADITEVIKPVESWAGVTVGKRE
jgi:3-hydroxyisobutyrate dehydrogenase-like beta-hydroxyacid dehydrogenase